MTERFEVELKFVVACDNTDEYWDALVDEFHDLAVKHGKEVGGTISARKIQPKRQGAVKD